MQRNPNPNPEHLTPRQMQILFFAREYRKELGYSPTLQELADELGVSKVTVFEHLGVLERKGIVRREKYRARSLEISEGFVFPDEPQMPFVGYIAAGSPIEAVEDRGNLDLAAMFPITGRTFVLGVRGDSMIDEQIRDGDYVVVEKQDRVRDGDTVVAILDSGEATLKKFRRVKGGKCRLEPANPAYKPLIVRTDRLQVQGKVIGVLRRY